MSSLLTWGLRIHSPSICSVSYSMGLSIHMHGECERSKQSCIGIIITVYSIEPYFICRDFPNLVCSTV